MSFKLERISATNLAGLAADNFCPRCFWLKARLGFKPPFGMFPKIFNELDGYQKAFTALYFKETGKLPPWLEQYLVEELLEVPEYGKFCATHESGVVISGITDHLFRLVSKKNLVLDYKTSRPAGDKMFNIYKTQLSIYSWISPRFGLGEVEQLVLVYYEPLTSVTEWQEMSWSGAPASGPIEQLPIEGIQLRFRPYVMPLDVLDINPLVLKAKELAEGSMPEPYFYCMECARVLDWARLITDVE